MRVKRFQHLADRPAVTSDELGQVSARVLQPAEQGAVVLTEEGVQLGVAGSTVERLHEAMPRRYLDLSVVDAEGQHAR